MSSSKLTWDQKCQANFFSSWCEFQDLNSRRMIESARQSGRLYFFEVGTELDRQSQSTCFESISISSENEIILWHLTLGHPNFRYYLFRNLFSNKDPYLFQCDMCELPKHFRESFPLQSYKPSKSFFNCSQWCSGTI